MNIGRLFLLKQSERLIIVLILKLWNKVFGGLKKGRVES